MYTLIFSISLLVLSNTILSKDETKIYSSSGNSSINPKDMNHTIEQAVSSLKKETQEALLLLQDQIEMIQSTLNTIQSNSILNVENLEYATQQTLTQCRALVIDLSDNTIKIFPPT